MKKWKLITTIAAALVVVGGGAGYTAYDYYAGNHVEVKDVISSPNPASTTSGAAAVVEAAKIDGTWNIQPASEVYFSVTTSKETVNFSVKSVTGSWQLNTADAAQNKAEGAVDLNVLSSGNSQRDNHIKAADYLNVEQNSKATFAVKSFDQLPKEWKDGDTVSFKMTGTLTIKGIDKEVTFDSKAQYDQGQLKLEGNTLVTFADFGMKNPHTVLLDTQNDVNVQLRLVLAK
jgi:polyisoprenoid-binding protein YceI